MAMQPYRTKVSVEEYLAIDRDSSEMRYEYSDGNMYMLAGGSANHAVIIANITGTMDIIQHPLLVVEVLSPSTRDYDRGSKFDYYQECSSIEEYMLVDTERKAVYLYRRKTENLWLLQLYGPDDRVELESVGGIVSVADMYEHAVLPEDTADEP